jgi:hypothetical protein
VITRLHWHLNAGLLPPVEPGSDGEHDALLGRRVVRSGRDDESRPAHPILIELLDHNLVEEGPKLVPNRLDRLRPGLRIHGAQDIRAFVTASSKIRHARALSRAGTEGRLRAMRSAYHTLTAAERRSITPMAEQIAFRRPIPDAITAGRAAEEWSVLSLSELRDCGLSPNQVTARVKKGWLHRVYPGVYALGHPAIPMQGRFLAAVKSVGTGAVLSHFSAAALWGFVSWDNRHPEVTVDRASARSRTGIRIHRSSVLERREVMRHERVPVTTPARTLVDLAAVVSERMLRAAIRRALGRERVTIRQLVRAKHRLGARRGSVRLGRVLAAAAPTRSELEDVVLDLILDAGLPPPDVNKPLPLACRRVIPDFRWPEQRLVVEADGAAWHDNPIARKDDGERQALLEAAGERVLRVTWAQAVGRPARTIERVRAAVRG